MIGILAKSGAEVRGASPEARDHRAGFCSAALANACAERPWQAQSGGTARVWSAAHSWPTPSWAVF
jgi:hypothetical protein